MLAHERQANIIEHLRQHRTVKIADMVEKFGISSLTARRDLDTLAARGILRRVYGGAVLAMDPASLPTDASQQSTQDQRERMFRKRMANRAKLTASLVEEGDTLFMGNGIMVQEVAKNLRHFSNLTVITSSLLVAQELVDTTNTIYVLGGLVHNATQAIGSPGDYDILRRFCADKAIYSCGGISVEHGVTSDNLVAVEIGRIMTEQSKRTIVVGGLFMFDGDSLRVTCPLSAVDTIVTDDLLPRELQTAITATGVKLLLTETEE